MKATEQHFPVLPFIVLYQVVLSSEPVNKMLKFKQSYVVLLSRGTVYRAVQGGSIFSLF